MRLVTACGMLMYAADRLGVPGRCFWFQRAGRSTLAASQDTLGALHCLHTYLQTNKLLRGECSGCAFRAYLQP